ncbi:MAG: type II toxin-antitoxin system VapC family toxin [Puniceicoccaceae bacterium]|nr:MAG: type II toxin-antitoxin system VapC family toxin [Puniceicoccaceae bacterium]
METQGIVSIDTNVLVRFLVKDGGATEQCRFAKQLFERHAVFIPESVFLETEWVLRAVYSVPRGEIHSAFTKLLNLARVLLPDRLVLNQVLTYFEYGFDFADALHLVRSEDHEMKSFDAAFINKARKSGRLASSPSD